MLNDEIEHINCQYNPISRLPYLHDKLKCLFFNNTPISQNFTSIDNKDMKNQINIYMHKFYTLKYKDQFRRWLWNVREKIAISKYSPDNLELLLMDVEDDNEFQEVLDSW